MKSISPKVAPVQVRIIAADDGDDDDDRMHELIGMLLKLDRGGVG